MSIAGGSTVPSATTTLLTVLQPRKSRLRKPGSSRADPPSPRYTGDLTPFDTNAIAVQVSGVGRAAELAAMVRERARLRGQLGQEAMARERAAAAAARERARAAASASAAATVACKSALGRAGAAACARAIHGVTQKWDSERLAEVSPRWHFVRFFRGFVTTVLAVN